MNDEENAEDRSTDEYSCKSDQTPRVRNGKTKEKSKENNENEYNIERATMEVIHTIIQEYLVDEKAELREINRLSTKITAKFTFHHQYNMEIWNNQLRKRVIQLQRINDECHQYIGELLAEYAAVSDLPTDNDNSLSMYNDVSMKGLKKGFLLEEKVKEERTKFQDDDESIESFSTTDDSYSSNDLSESSNDIGLSTYEKRTLGIGEKKDMWNTYDKDIEVNSDSDSSYEDYRFE